ncbi:competence type IV pilus major pilin ComGC [Paucisalibacillus globulus]|jgi:competence protein ComGC|uniref:competence type IV pilus major pilin ComGC n=1 Tax=Paucisalibacillus globulus TaxID=351095 RepID=UPI000BB75F08|nr:competence type IV pilus major pilin ComGC [Paucisalibacillus globulus]
MLHNQKGFTLIEMLVVLMIVSVLMILIIPNLGSKSQDVQSKGCEALVSVVQTQVDTYYLETYSYPNDLQELVEKKYIKENQTYCSSDDNPLNYNSSTGIVNVP